MPYMLSEGWKTWNWFDPVCLLHAKLYARLPKLGYLAAFHEWFSDHVIPWCRQQLPYLQRSSRTQEECGFALGDSMLQGRVESWMVTIVLNVTSGTDTVASCFKPTRTPALSHGVKELARLLLIKACCCEFSKALGQGAAFQTAQGGFKVFLNGMAHKIILCRIWSEVEFSPFKWEQGKLFRRNSGRLSHNCLCSTNYIICNIIFANEFFKCLTLVMTNASKTG